MLQPGNHSDLLLSNFCCRRATEGPDPPSGSYDQLFQKVAPPRDKCVGAVRLRLYPFPYGPKEEKESQEASGDKPQQSESVEEKSQGI